MVYVPVISKDGKPLMPAKASRVKKWIKSGKALKRWNKGLFYVQLTIEVEENIQPIVVAIDPGSKFEGYTVKSEAHTYLNLQIEAITWVSKRVEVRRNMRRGRRFRKTPCRKPRFNMARRLGWLPPSTYARWQFKLNVVKRLGKMYPLRHSVVEDIKARSWKGAKRWNRSFSPLETGKAWFYFELEKIVSVSLKQGYETYELRLAAGLKKTGKKSERSFNAHCVDSWVLANDYIGGHTVPDNTAVTFIKPIQFHRRQLHAFQPSKEDIRRPYGGTKSLMLKRGSLVKHKVHGICVVGGTMNGKISLHNRNTGERFCRNTKVEDITFLCYNSWYLNTK